MVLCQCPRAKKQLSRSKANALIPAVTGGRSRKKYSRITTPTSLFIFNTSDTMVKVCFHLISPQRWQLLLQGEVKGCFQASGSVSSRPVPHADYHVLCQAQPGSRVQLSRSCGAPVLPAEFLLGSNSQPDVGKRGALYIRGPTACTMLSPQQCSSHTQSRDGIQLKPHRVWD